MNGVEKYSEIAGEQQEAQAPTSGRLTNGNGTSASFGARAPEAPMMSMDGGPTYGQQHGRPLNGSGPPEWQGQSNGTSRIAEMEGRHFGD